MPDQRRQFRVLYWDFLSRLVDLELFSAGGDVQRLLVQFAAMLAAFGFTITIFTLPALARASLPYQTLLVAVRTEEEFLIATTMAISGLFAVLACNAVFPDRRDILILGLLPVRVRTIFLAKVAAIATALGVSVAAVNLFTGLTLPVLAIPPGGGLPGGLRFLGAHWLVTMAAALFVCGGLLAVQGLAAQFLSYRLFLRVSSFLQLAAFFGILGLYFLKPSFLAAGRVPWLGRWLPSFWFCGLLQYIDGATGPFFGALAGRALWGLAIVSSVAAATFALAYQRNIRRIVEEPDIAPAGRSRPATRIGAILAGKLLDRSIERAIVLFAARTVARSRQHRLVLSAYAGIGLAIGLAYARDLIYRSRDIGSLYLDARWDQVNGSFLAASLVVLFFAVIGVRGAFAMPMSLPANWVFRVTAVHSPRAYFAAVRKSLLVLAVVPVWTASAIAFPAIWPARFAAEHLAVMAVTGALLVETSLYRFRKVPFACSYLPGKANLHVRLGAGGIAFLAALSIGIRIEFWAMQRDTRFAVVLAILVGGAAWAHRRTSEFAASPGIGLQFEDAPQAELDVLDLRADGVWSSEDAYLDAIDSPSGTRKRRPRGDPPRGGSGGSRLTSLSLGASPGTPLPKPPVRSARSSISFSAISAMVRGH